MEQLHGDIERSAGGAAAVVVLSNGVGVAQRAGHQGLALKALLKLLLVELTAGVMQHFERELAIFLKIVRLEDHLKAAASDLVEELVALCNRNTDLWCAFDLHRSFRRLLTHCGLSAALNLNLIEPQHRAYSAALK